VHFISHYKDRQVVTTPKADDSFDSIIIGSGTAGATLARQLSASGRTVLLLERGKYRPLKETVWTLASMFDEVKVADKLKDARVFTAGGCSAMYLAVMDEPPIDEFRALGIDLGAEYDEARRELPLGEMRDELLSPQAHRLKEAALAAGYDWKKKLMLIDQSMCDGGYCYEAKWKALSYVDEAVRLGARLQCQARVERVLIENGRAVGVECRIAGSPFGGQPTRFHARKIIVSAGSLATPLILRNSGLADVATKGYYVDPSSIMFGRIPRLRGRDGFAGAFGTTLDDGTKLLDANAHKLPFYMFMIQFLHPMRVFSYAEHVGIMVKAHDAVGGSLSADGHYHKELDPAVFEKLKRGEDAARRILEHAGATRIFQSPLMTGGTFGTLRVGDDVDVRLETRIDDLHVCDGSLIPENGRVAPTLTLICLAKYLARTLTKQSNAYREEPRPEEARIR
jgi:choline dehydrogenase-like flavoprotein